MKVVVVNGLPRSGKDTFVNDCIEILGKKGINISTVDFVKEVARHCGWDGEKTPRNRKFLSDLKQLLVDWNDVPYKDVEKKIDIFKRSLYLNDIDEDKGVVFLHIREPEEIQKFVERMDAITVFVTRKDVKNQELSNNSDANVYNYKYDYEINNDGSLEDLRHEAQKFISMITLLF